MNAASATGAVTMVALIQWEPMNVCVHLERSYIGIKKTVLVSKISEQTPFFCISCSERQLINRLYMQKNIFVFKHIIGHCRGNTFHSPSND